jgi:hypothetical protein
LLYCQISNSSPLTRDTILCGDFNARFGTLLGDTNANARGNSLRPWLEESSLSILNASLVAYGIPTFKTFRRQQEVHSIIDLFMTNIGELAIINPQLAIESDLSLGSDHRLMTLTFEYVPLSGNSLVSAGDSALAPRRQWKLSKLRKKRPLGLLRESFRSSVAPLVGTLSGLVSGSTAGNVRPDIDTLNDSLNRCLYESLDESIGVKSGRPGHWKKYWTQDIEDAARERDTMYSRWRWASRFAKVETWHIYQAAHKRFRSLIQAAKRRSWHKFCSDLEKDFSKATAAVKRLKRNKTSSATYSHPDGPTESVTTMASHLASVYDGSMLTFASRPAAPQLNASDLPYTVSNDLGLFDADTLFRPISLTSVMRKLFEFALMPALDEHSPSLDVAQGGFRPQRSPLDQALCLHDLMHDYSIHNKPSGCQP